MGRRRTSGELEEMLRLARAREQARLQHRIDNPAPYRGRGPRTEGLYRSMLRFKGTSRAVYEISVDKETVPGKLTLAQVGLLAANAALGAGEILIGAIKGSGVKPTKIQWFFGVAPQAVPPSTGHGRWIRRWARDTGGQSHRSTPFSRVSGPVDSAGLTTAFHDLIAGPLAPALGAGGDATLIFERGNVSN
ncbi:hypothetical protein [Argonema galeatum]|uniref:hypothetical protein n=1 Tax=Argonema galeatum TaxID=2942762 RepID=UPI00201365B4|nr:hypothetical protein [Argonema galeatum]MCL1468678.1 hypothetical protein [Argonema galeatum A003/A1]